MRAVTFAEFGPPTNLKIIDAPVPEPGPEDVVVRVAGAGVNWIDVSLRSGRLAQGGLVVPAESYGLGWDVAGVIEAVGAEVTTHAVGDHVIGLRDVLGMPGTHAELVRLHHSAVVCVPEAYVLTALAGLPLAGVTAVRALAASGLDTGDTLLVTGAGGAIGRLCVALALGRGIRVVAAARDSDADVLTALGAEVLAVDAVADRGSLGAAARERAGRGVDAVVDTANLGVAAHEALRGAGTFVALVRPFAPLPLRGTTVVVHESWADPAALAEVVRQLEAGVIEPPEVSVAPLAEAAAAHAVLEAGGVRGRIVLVP
jgi:NADPH:quinone reductase-like Zn-dependent oxidoreductase